MAILGELLKQRS